MEHDDATEFSAAEIIDEVDALALMYWKCRKEGHRYHDCKAKRKIF